MSKLPYVYWCNHLTEVGCTWRTVDFDSRVVVKGLKQEEFNGYLQAKIEGKHRRFDEDNVEELIQFIMPLVGKFLRDDISGKISVVPTRNAGGGTGQDPLSHWRVTSGDSRAGTRGPHVRH